LVADSATSFALCNAFCSSFLAVISSSRERKWVAFLEASKTGAIVALTQKMSPFFFTLQNSPFQMRPEAIVG